VGIAQSTRGVEDEKERERRKRGDALYGGGEFGGPLFYSGLVLREVTGLAGSPTAALQWEETGQFPPVWQEERPIGVGSKNTYLDTWLSSFLPVFPVFCFELKLGSTWIIILAPLPTPARG